MDRPKIYYAFIITLLIILTIISGCWGSTSFKIIFENQTQETLTIFYDDYKVGIIDTKSQITYDRASWDRGEYQITAINSKGVTIFSKTLTHETMEKIETKVYKVVITSSTNATETQPSDNLTFKE